MITVATPLHIYDLEMQHFPIFFLRVGEAENSMAILREIKNQTDCMSWRGFRCSWYLD